jgi:hypothetical protein
VEEAAKAVVLALVLVIQGPVVVVVVELDNDAETVERLHVMVVAETYAEHELMVVVVKIMQVLE